MSELVRVPIGACRCPGTPHEGDWVEMSPVLSAPLGVAAMIAMQQSASDLASVQSAITRAWIRHAVVAWSVVDDEGNAVPVTPDAAEDRLTWTGGGFEVSEMADELYGGELFLPLANRLTPSSSDGPTTPSTSATTPSGSVSPTSSKSSSPAPTDGMPSQVPATS